MSRYIDYDAIDYRNDKLHDKSEDFLNGVYYMAERIEEAQSIDIVRCGECKFFWKYGDLPTKCVFHLSLVNADDFCSYGERGGRQCLKYTKRQKYCTSKKQMTMATNGLSDITERIQSTSFV